MAIVIVPGVGKVDNVTGKVVEPAQSAIKKPVQPPKVKATTVVPTQTIGGVGQVGPNGQVVVPLQNKGIPVPKQNQQQTSKTVSTTNTNAKTYQTPTAPVIASNYANTTEGNINRVWDAKAKNQYDSYRKVYDKTMGNLNVAEGKIEPAYQNSKQETTSASELQRLNFQEYLKANGVSAGGRLQSELSRQSALQNSLGKLATDRANTISEVERKKADAANAFNTDWENYLAQNKAGRDSAIYEANAKAAKEAAKAAAKAAKSSGKDKTNAGNDGLYTDMQQLNMPSTVEKNLKSQFGVVNRYAPGDTKQLTPIGIEWNVKDQPRIWKYIITQPLKPDEIWNMMGKYGMGEGKGMNGQPKAGKDKTTGTYLGKNNLRLFLTVVANTKDQKMVNTYAKKLGIVDIKDKKTGKVTLSINDQVANIIKGLDKYGNAY